MEQTKATKNSAPQQLSLSPKIPWAYLFMGLVLLLVCFIRLRLLATPLERDEGEYAYMGQLLLQGVLPYIEAYNMKFPGIYFIYAIVLAIFGEESSSIHFSLLLVNLGTSILIFLLGKRLLNRTVGMVAAVSFLMVTLSPSIQGIWANSEHFIVAFAIAGILLLLIAVEKDHLGLLFLSGLLLGSAFLIKQPGVFFALFGIVYLSWMLKEKLPVSLKEFCLRVGVLIVGILMPIVSVMILYAITGNFGAFWFWTFEYAFRYASLISVSQGMTQLQMRLIEIWSPNFPIALGALLGLTALMFNKDLRPKSVFLYGFFIASFLSICPGFYFRPHYFVLLVPAVCLLTGTGIHWLAQKIRPSNTRWIALSCVIAVLVVYPLVTQRSFFFQLSPLEASRAVYGMNPFPEAVEIASYIEENTDKGTKIAVIGSEPQIYFYSKRRAATGFLYTYALMEPHDFALEMQKDMIHEIESNKPKYIILVNIPTSWLMRPDSDRLLIEWGEQYLHQNYTLAGVVDIISPEVTIYKWDQEAASYSPTSRWNLLIFERVESG